MIEVNTKKRYDYHGLYERPCLLGLETSSVGPYLNYSNSLNISPHSKEALLVYN